MSAITLRPASPSISRSLRALFHRRFAGSRSQGRLYRSLKDLPDHLLLDIGVDPRDVPARGEGEIAQPELVYAGQGAMRIRMAAKS
jgi:uncharacterized protein YjiS (DUF1127 family)